MSWGFLVVLCNFIHFIPATQFWVFGSVFCICCNIATRKTQGEIKFSVSIATQIDGTAYSFLKNVSAGTPKLNLKMACAVNYQCPVLSAIEASQLSRQVEFRISNSKVFYSLVSLSHLLSCTLA